MLENIFLFMLAMGGITFIMGLYEEWENLLSFLLCFTSILFLFSAWAGTTGITIPGDSTHYMETGIGIICMGLIILNVIGAVTSVINVNAERNRP